LHGSAINGIISGDSRNVGEPGHNFEGNFINPISEYNNNVAPTTNQYPNKRNTTHTLCYIRTAEEQKRSSYI
jgi:hypothetical protein